MKPEQIEKRRAWKAAFRARITLFAEQRQIPKSELAWLGRIKHEDLVRFAQQHRVDYAWMLTGDQPEARLGKGGDMNNVIKFPYDACRRVHSRKPRRSKNDTPEERAAEGAQAKGCAVLPLREAEPAKISWKGAVREVLETLSDPELRAVQRVMRALDRPTPN